MFSSPYVRAFALCMVPAIVLVLLALAVQALATGDPQAMQPAVTTLLVGALVSQVAAILGLAGLIRQNGAGAPRVAEQTVATVGFMKWVLLAALGATVIWHLRSGADEALASFIFALVAAQAWFAFEAARRQFAVDAA